MHNLMRRNFKNDPATATGLICFHRVVSYFYDHVLQTRSQVQEIAMQCCMHSSNNA